MVRVCRERGTAFGCGTGYWDAPYLLEIADWIRAGNIGQLTAAAIPGGLPTEVSGGGCVSTDHHAAAYWYGGRMGGGMGVTTANRLDASCRI